MRLEQVTIPPIYVRVALGWCSDHTSKYLESDTLCSTKHCVSDLEPLLSLIRHRIWHHHTSQPISR